MVLQRLEKLDELLNRRINGKIVDQVITRLTAAGDNYMSVILKLDLKVKNSKNIEESVQAVAKLVPPGFVNTEYFSVSEVLFRTELVWYDFVVPILKDFDVDGLTTDIYSKLLGGRLSLDKKSKKADKDALIVLEYLQGYKIIDRQLGFDYPTTKEVLKKLAGFHAAPVALKLQKPALFKEQILPCFANTVPVPPKDDHLPRMIGIIKECPECEQFIPKCEKALQHEPFVRNKLSCREPWATLAHNDFWMNNIMIKTDNSDLEIKFIDYQAVFYTTIACDLTFFLLVSVQTAVLREHYDELVKLYYDLFIGYLKQLKVEDTDQFKFEDYLKELEMECKNGQFSHALFFTNFVFREKETGADSAKGEDPESLKKLMDTISLKQKQKVWDITKFCGEKNWI